MGGAYYAGLSASKSFTYHQDSWGSLDMAEQNDRFGAALAAGDFDRDGYSDLAVGVPGESVMRTGYRGLPQMIGAAGAVNVFYGNRGGLKYLNGDLWHQGK